MITRRLPQDGDYAGFDTVREFIMQGDFRFGNLETTVHNFESCAGARSGGSWLCSPPGVLKDLKKFGMNIFSTANNHALDYSYDGLLRTLEYLEAEDIPFSGTGRDLAAAARPVYLDTLSGRYALISCTMSFNPENMAGAQSSVLPGRPGVNGIRVDTRYCLPHDELIHLKRIAESLGINDTGNILRGEGYRPQLKDGQVPFGELMFETGEKPEIALSVNPVDLKRVTDAVVEAIASNKYQMIRLNFPNGDMVGHTGSMEAVLVSMEALDLCLGRIKEAVKAAGGVLVISADHGNADDMLEHDKKGNVKVDANGVPARKTSHSLNPVPCIIYDPESKGEYENTLKEGLGISSLAATCIELLGYKAPADYDESVLNFK